MPMTPGGSDLHINQALTRVSVAYFQDTKDFIADKVFPGLPVDKRSDVFWKYSKSDWRRVDAEERAPGAESAGIGWSETTDQYYAKIYAAHVDIDDQTRANADSNWHLDADATRLITQQLLLQKDQFWANNFFKTGVWGTEYTGVSASPSGSNFLQWNVSGSDPLSDTTNWCAAFRLSVGRPVNFMVIGVDVWNALKNHAAILDRIKYTQKGVVTEQLVAEFFGVQDLYVAWASQSTGPKIPDAAAQDAAASYSFVANKQSILLGFRPKAPGLLTPSAGYTFNWRGYKAGNNYGLSMKQFRIERIEAERIEGSAAYVQKMVSADCGIFVNTAVGN